MITIKNTQRTFSIDTDKLHAQAQTMLAHLGYTDYDLGIWITTNKTIQKYNSQYRDKNKPTDILSFPYHTELQAGEQIVVNFPEDKNLGDLIISPQYMDDTRYKWNRDFETHLTALLAHGIAHLLGHDHIEDDEYIIMQKLENQLIKAAQG